MCRARRTPHHARRRSVCRAGAAARVGPAAKPAAARQRRDRSDGALHRIARAEEVVVSDPLADLAALQSAAQNGKPPLEGVEPRSLHDVAETFARWLHFPDLGVVYVVLGTVAANMGSGDPLWLLVVGAPG